MDPDQAECVLPEKPIGVTKKHRKEHEPVSNKASHESFRICPKHDAREYSPQSEASQKQSTTPGNSNTQKLSTQHSQSTGQATTRSKTQTNSASLQPRSSQQSSTPPTTKSKLTPPDSTVGGKHPEYPKHEPTRSEQPQRQYSKNYTQRTLDYLRNYEPTLTDDWNSMPGTYILRSDCAPKSHKSLSNRWKTARPELKRNVQSLAHNLSEYPTVVSENIRVGTVNSQVSIARGLNPHACGTGEGAGRRHAKQLGSENNKQRGQNTKNMRDYIEIRKMVFGDSASSSRQEQLTRSDSNQPRKSNPTERGEHSEPTGNSKTAELARSAESAPKTSAATRARTKSPK